MVNHKDERVIYIKDMLFAVLFRWRTVLIVALIAALLLGGYRGVSLSGSSTDNAATQEALDDYALQEKTLALEITSLENRIEAFSTYITDSPFMTLNPHNVYVSTLSIYPKPLSNEIAPTENSTDPADTMIAAYRTLLLTSEAQNTIATALGMEGLNMEGILDVTCDQTTDLLTVIIRQADAEMAETILDTVQTMINEAEATVTEVVGAHKVSVLSRSVSLRNDMDLAQFQTKKNDELLKLKETLKVRTAEQNAMVAPQVQTTSGTQILTSAIKYAILGGALGFFATAAFIVLFHLARSKVYSRRTLEDQTGLRILGCIPCGKKCCGIDSWLRKKEGRTVVSPEEGSTLIAARIRNLCGSESALLLTGACSADDRLPVLEALKAAGCTVIANGDLLRDPETVNALNRCTGVVFLEQCGKSHYATVGEAVAQVEATGKPILGCVLIDG